jgi:hypothetical protein
MDKKTIQDKKLSPLYIKTVVELCQAKGIKYFKSLDLELQFEDKAMPLANPVSVEKEDKDASRDQLLGDLLLENPLAYEEALSREN